MFGILSKSETSSYPSCPRHAHHTVTVQSWLHLYLNHSIGVMLMSMVMAPWKSSIRNILSLNPMRISSKRLPGVIGE